MRAKRTVCKGRETTDLKSQTDLSSNHHLLFLVSKAQLPQLYSEFPNTSWRGAMRTNDKAGKDLAGQEARRQTQGRAGCMGALLLPPPGGKPGPGRRRPSRVWAPMQRKQSPLSSHQETCRKGSVWKRAALHLANVHLCFLLESITFFTSPGLFTQTSCSLTTRIAFSAILLTAQMSAVSLGVWWELLPDSTQPSQHSF